MILVTQTTRAPGITAANKSRHNWSPTTRCSSQKTRIPTTRSSQKTRIPTTNHDNGLARQWTRLAQSSGPQAAHITLRGMAYQNHTRTNLVVAIHNYAMGHDPNGLHGTHHGHHTRCHTNINPTTSQPSLVILAPHRLAQW